MTQFRIDLPFPPSVNGLWRKGRAGLYSSPRYRSWKRAADNLGLAQNPLPKLKGAFRAEIWLSRAHRRGDVDNLAKAPLDILQRWGVIEDDRLAESVATRWCAPAEAPEGCRVYLFPAEATPARRRQIPLPIEEVA